ncbi:MAG TPA: YbaB/EbfC family nucleoid-associated protein [Actinoplanes sp.]|nr:YbaB/EbfC family nucleoid-associated protein [Actinoplanes sp.]
MTNPDQSMDDLRRAIDDYPRRLAETTARAHAAARATVTARDESGQVTVTASGQGDILSVRVTGHALHDGDPHTLATRITTTVNAALSQAEATLAEATTGTLPDDTETTARLDAFEQRIDAAINRLDRLLDD